MFSIEYGNFIRIGFSSIPNGIIAYLFGPTVGGIFSGTLDIIKYILKPTVLSAADTGYDAGRRHVRLYVL